jgi:hypothetical protein
MNLFTKNCLDAPGPQRRPDALEKNMAIRIGRKGKSPMGAIMAILCGGAVAAGVMLTPIGLIEMGATSSGLSGILPAATPPLGDTARLVLAFALGIGGMGLVAAVRAIASRILGPGPSVIRIGYEIGYEDEDENSFNDANFTDGPRRPLFASSDLEGIASLAERSAPALSPEGLRLPVVPEALDISELELGGGMKIAPALHAPEAPAPRPAPRMSEPAPVIADPSGVLAAARIKPSDYSALSITELVERFERGLTHRRRLIAQAVAAKRASEAEAVAHASSPEPAQMAVPQQPAPEHDRKGIDTEVDEALRAALGTLQRMTARAA